MKTIMAIIFGFLSALMIYLESIIVIFDFASGSEPPDGYIFLVIIFSWIASSYFIRSKAIKFTQIIYRSFLIYAIEWAAMYFAAKIFAVRLAMSTSRNADSLFEIKENVDFSKLISSISGGVSVFFLMVSLIVFLIFYFINRRQENK